MGRWFAISCDELVEVVAIEVMSGDDGVLNVVGEGVSVRVIGREM